MNKSSASLGTETFADPTPERLKHAKTWTVGNARDKRDRTVTILDPFEAAHERGGWGIKGENPRIAQSRYEAGVKFRHHFERGGLHGVLSSLDLNASRTEPFGRTFLGTDEQVHHRLQYRSAEKLLGMVETAVLRWVIVEGITLHGAGERMGWRDRKQASAAAVQVMRMSLDKLCGMWGIR